MQRQSKYPELNNKEWLEDQYEEKKRTLCSIANVIGCSRETVKKALLRHNINIRTEKYPQLSNRDWLYQKYWQEGLSCAEIGKILGSSRTPIEKSLNHHNIKIRTLSEAQHNIYTKHPMYPKLRNRNWLIQKYIADNLYAREIAEIVGCTETSVLEALKNLGIERRNSSEAQISKKRELNNREWLYQKYCDEKLSLSKIAKILGCGYSAVRSACVRSKIRIRGHGEKGKGKLNPMYDVHRYGKRAPMYGKHHSKSTRDKISKNHADISGKNHPLFGKHLSVETREKIARKHIELWRNPEYVKKVMDGLHAKPNKLEQKVDKILQKNFPNEWKYNGDFSCGVVIGGMIPDFINTNGKKVVIEVFGDAFHNPDRAFINLGWKQQEFGRVASYSQVGYKCIIFWEHDLMDDNIAEDVISCRLKKEEEK